MPRYQRITCRQRRGCLTLFRGDKYLDQSIVASLAVPIGLAFASAVFADEATVECVQEDFNALGHDAGTADGKMGTKSRNAADKSAAVMGHGAVKQR